MNRKRRFEVLLRIAEARERDAARVLSDRKSALQESHEKLEQLLLYRADYGNDLSKQDGIGLGVQIQDYWLFVDRLNRAISEQRQQLHELGNAVETSKQQWQDTHKQLAILGKVAERIQEVDRTEEDRRGQRLIDDLAGIAYARGSRMG